LSAPNVASNPGQSAGQAVGPQPANVWPTKATQGNPLTQPGPPPGQKVTVVNGTGDPRVIWEDGHIAIIYAKDFPAGTGMGRSRTRGDIKDAINAAVDDSLQTMPGGGKLHEFIKVNLKELLQRPYAGSPQTAKVVGRLPISPSQFVPVAPKVAQGGSYKGRIIPDFPHTCAVCNGPYYQGMFEGIHPTPDGKCPAAAKTTKKGR
jgi:hypothetical protein